MLAIAAISALQNLIVLGGFPFLGYVLYQKLRHKRTFSEIAEPSALRSLGLSWEVRA